MNLPTEVKAAIEAELSIYLKLLEHDDLTPDELEQHECTARHLLSRGAEIFADQQALIQQLQVTT